MVMMVVVSLCGRERERERGVVVGVEAINQ